MPPEPAAGDLAARADRAALALGLPAFRRVATGGGSDANLTADLGVPTLDGLGVVGSEIHTTSEWCLRRSIPERAALAAALIQDLIERS
jgi:glutamate carboxypeptidase